MQYLTPYHIATYLLAIFAAAHTYGGLYRVHDYGIAANAVFASMKSVHFNFRGADCTFYGFYFGFGLMATIFLLFSSFLTWQLAEARDLNTRAALKPIGWALFVAYIPVVVLSWTYFFVGPGVFSTLILGLMGWECWTRY